MKDLIPVRKEDMEDNEKPPAKEITYDVEYDPIGQKFFIHLGNYISFIESELKAVNKTTGIKNINRSRTLWENVMNAMPIII